MTAIGMVAGAGVLAACAAGPDYRRPDPGTGVRAAFREAAADGFASTAAADRWWESLGDTLLGKLEDRALAANPDLAAAEDRVAMARARSAQARAAFWPQADVDARAARDRLSRHGENLALIPFSPSTTVFSDFRAGFDVSFEIDLAGRTRREAEAAFARLGSSAESRNFARVVIASEVASAYSDYRAARTLSVLAHASLALDAAREALVARARQAGSASAIEEQRASADRFLTQAAGEPLEAAERAALYRLAALLGGDADALAVELAQGQAWPELPGTVPVGLPVELLRRRPDVRRAERDLAAATADVGSAVAAQFPRLRLLGDIGADAVHTGDLTSAASRYWSVAPELTVPIFAGGRLRAAAQQARAACDAALASYRATVLAALADTETALVRYARGRRELAALSAARDTLEASVALSERLVRAGESSEADLLAAQRARNAVIDEALQARARLLQGYIALQKALGGGWQGGPQRDTGP